MQRHQNDTNKLGEHPGEGKRHYERHESMLDEECLGKKGLTWRRKY